MLIRYLGHSFFSFTLENGLSVVTDPYGDFYAYPPRRIDADFCLISHHHFDHDGVSCVGKRTQILDQPGETALAYDTKVIAVLTWHDEKKGALRGPNLFHVLEAEGLRIGHAGDLGHILTEEQVTQIGKLDLLLIPVGGFYTIDADGALENIRLLQPKVTVPMHYRTMYNEEMTIAPLDVFLKRANAEDTQLPILRIMAEDISERPPFLTMAVSE